MEIRFLKNVNQVLLYFLKICIDSKSLEKPYALFIGITKELILVSNKSVYLNTKNVLVPKAV